MTLRLTLLAAFSIFATAAWAWCGPHRDRYETASYNVVSRSGDVEVREYTELRLVSAPMDGRQKANANQSFRSLFSYISGENEAGSKIAMTTPVFMDDSRMSFVLPATVSAEDAPGPKGEGVALTQFPGGTFVVLRFPGKASRQAEEKAEQRLRQWAQENGILLSGSAMFAYYDPPFTLPPFRRNEVLIRKG